MEATWVRPGRGVAVGVAAAIADLQGEDRLTEVIVVVAPGATAANPAEALRRAAHADASRDGGCIVADLVINKPLGLSPRHIEFKRAHLYDINPVGVGAMLRGIGDLVTAFTIGGAE